MHVTLQCLSVCRCRHRDGIWLSADEMPRTADGRPLSYVAINGHGSYPRAGFIPRIFLAFNDRTGTGANDAVLLPAMPPLHSCCQSTNHSIYLMSWGATGTQQTIMLYSM